MYMSGDAELVIGPTRWNVDWRRVGYIFCFFDFELWLLSRNRDTVRPILASWHCITTCKSRFSGVITVIWLDGVGDQMHIAEKTSLSLIIHRLIIMHQQQHHSSVLIFHCHVTASSTLPNRRGEERTARTQKQRRREDARTDVEEKTNKNTKK